MKRVNWAAVATFYILACAISWPVFWWRDVHRESWTRWAAPGFVKGLLPALGPATAAAVVLVAFRKTHRRRVTLWGTSAWRSATFAGVMVAGLTAVGVGDDQPHLTGLVIGLMLLAYAMGEEFGWRGFLQDALAPLRPRPRWLLIGLLWGAWHFTTFVRPTLDENLGQFAIMIPVWVIGSMGMNQATNATGSLLVVAALHMIFNISGYVPRSASLPALGVSLAVWIYLLKTWRPRPGEPAPMPTEMV